MAGKRGLITALMDARFQSCTVSMIVVVLRPTHETQITNEVAGAACLLRILVRQGFSEGSTVPAPDRVAVTVSDDSGGVEMIGVDIKHFCYVAGDGDGHR